MKPRNSLFLKYFRICASIILLSIVFLGVVLLLFASQYFKDDKYELLSNNVEQAMLATLSNYKLNNYEAVSPSTLTVIYEVLGGTLDSRIFLVDNGGRTLLCSEGAACGHFSYLVPPSVLGKVAVQGEYREMGNLGGVYREQFFTVGRPVIDPISGKVIGAIFSSASASDLNTFLLDMFKMFAVSSLGAILVSFVMIYFISSTLVRPLQQMLGATQRFAHGDFSERVPVESDDEMGQLAMSFNSMASYLAALEAMRRTFVANVSHELKTPMTTISGFVDGILDGTIPPEKQEHYLQVVSTETKRLSRLVRSMLSISRIEAGEMKLNLQPVDLNDIICRTVFTFETAIEEKRLEIRGLDAERAMVYADSDLVHQVVYNLVENAVKFTDEGGYIEFSSRVEEGMVYTSVTNSGKGIPEEDLPRLFERFYKSDKSRGLDKTGVGLGLYIVKTILGTLGGEIFVSSLPGQYTSFAFSLPPVPAAPPAKAPPAKNQKNQPGKIFRKNS